MSVNPQPAEPREGTRSPEPVPATVAHPSPAQKRDADPYRPARPIPAAELQPLTVTTTEYVPASAVVAFTRVGFCADEVKPFAPVHA